MMSEPENQQESQPEETTRPEEAPEDAGNTEDAPVGSEDIEQMFTKFSEQLQKLNDKVFPEDENGGDADADPLKEREEQLNQREQQLLEAQKSLLKEKYDIDATDEFKSLDEALRFQKLLEKNKVGLKSIGERNENEKQKPAARKGPAWFT
jgi:hypothetical protein